MRWSRSLAPLAAAAALSVVATALLSVAAATATEPQRARAAGPCAEKQNQADMPWSSPKYFDLTATLDATDEAAALEAVEWALTEVADGATFVWHRQHGRLSGLVQPTSSFRDANDRVCRHLVMMLISGGYFRKAEGIACRQADGVWLLEG
jgi:surface antigen